MSSTTPQKPAPSFTTPTKRAAIVNAEAGPSRVRPSGLSPAYSSRKHSLYGIEDRVIIDPGSRIWKVGFSGEVDPRACFWASDSDSGGSYCQGAWDLDLERVAGCEGDRQEGKRLVSERVLAKMQKAYIQYLMSDPKARKVIVLENTFLPQCVKEQIARALFENLKVPSVSFTPSSVLALAACGRMTGLVIDCGWLETSVTPVSCSRPLFHFARSTPLAGRSLQRRLRSLLRHHATYLPPPASLGNLSRRPIPVPQAILSDRLVERIITEACFVAETPPEQGGVVDTSADGDEDHVVGPHAETLSDTNEGDSPAYMHRLRNRYALGGRTKDWSIPVDPLPTDSKGLGHGTLVVPGWIRERAAEVMFGDQLDEEVPSIPEIVLQCVQVLPVDLRPIMLSSLLVVGGTPSLPGFVPRLHNVILQMLALSSAHQEGSERTPHHLESTEYRLQVTKEWRKRHHKPYQALSALASHVAILNDPTHREAPGGADEKKAISAGKAPRWVPSLMSWVGGSLAGALKTGGPELLREDFDTIMATMSARGDVWKSANAEAMTTDETDDAEDVERHEPEVGISIEDLGPGMALYGGGARKRWWDAERKGAVGDWSRSALLA